MNEHSHDFVVYRAVESDFLIAVVGLTRALFVILVIRLPVTGESLRSAHASSGTSGRIESLHKLGFRFSSVSTCPAATKQALLNKRYRSILFARATRGG